MRGRYLHRCRELSFAIRAYTIHSAGMRGVGGWEGGWGDVVIRNETKQPRPDKIDALHKIFTRLHVTYGFYGLCIN